MAAKVHDFPLGKMSNKRYIKDFFQESLDNEMFVSI